MIPEGACILICRICADEPPHGPLVQPFASAAERGRWAGQHRRGTGHDAWFCADGWPSPADAIAAMRAPRSTS